MRTTLILLCILFIAACENIWFKPGTSNDDLARDKAECGLGTEQAEDDADESDRRFQECMAARGWWHSGSASKRTAAADTAAATPPAPATDPAPPDATGFNIRVIGVEPGSSDRGVEEPRGAAVEAGPAASGGEPGPSGALSGNLSQSWWKRGGRDIDLARDQENCREKSGVDLPAGTPYRWGESAAFDRCMRSIGWRGP